MRKLTFIFTGIPARYGIFVTALLLMALGLWNLYVIATVQDGRPGWAITKQLISVSIGTGIGLYMYYRTSYRKMTYTTTFRVMCLCTGVMLIFALFGPNINGARRWINLIIFTFQPSELAKFMSILWTMRLLEKQRRMHHDGSFWDYKSFLARNVFAKMIPNRQYETWPILRTFAENNTAFRRWLQSRTIPIPDWIVYPVICAALIILEPDLGTALLVLGFPFIMWLVGGGDIRSVRGGLLIGFGALVVAVLGTPYRRERLLALWDPFAHAQDNGFQVVQSMIAVGTGGFFGLSGAGTGKFAYLPEIRTDFAFAAFCQEQGTLGALVVILLFICFTIYGLRIAWNACDYQGRILALGLTALISLQALYNMLMVVGSMLVSGVSMPFISSGGSVLLVNSMVVALLMSIDYQTARTKRALGKKGDIPSVRSSIEQRQHVAR